MRLWNRTREEMGDEARAVLDAEPEQDDAMGLVLLAWDDLLTCRPLGMDLGPVPWSAAMDWCDRHGLDAQGARVVWSVIRRIDLADRERRTRPAPGSP